MAESGQPKTSEELQELFQMKKKILQRDHDIDKVTGKLKQLQQQEVEQAREITGMRDSSGNVRLVKAKILDLKKDVRRKEAILELEEQKIRNVG